MNGAASGLVAAAVRRARPTRKAVAAASRSTSVTWLPSISAQCSYSSSSATPIDDHRSSSSSSSPSTSSSSSASSSSSSPSGPRCAQPQPSTHPHLFPSYNTATPFPQLFPLPNDSYRSDYSHHESLRNGMAQQQLTPGITRQEYEDRRAKLMEQVDDGSVILVMGGRIKYMSGQIFYRFRQASNFWYLTGFQEADSACVLIKDGSSPRGFKMTMFVPFSDSLYEAWHGPRAGADGAVGIFGADEALEMDNEGRNLANYLKEVLPKASKIYHDMMLRFMGVDLLDAAGPSALIPSTLQGEKDRKLILADAATLPPLPGSASGQLPPPATSSDKPFPDGKTEAQVASEAKWAAYYNAGTAALIILLILVAVGTFILLRLRRRGWTTGSSLGGGEISLYNNNTDDSEVLLPGRKKTRFGRAEYRRVARDDEEEEDAVYEDGDEGDVERDGEMEMQRLNNHRRGGSSNNGVNGGTTPTRSTGRSVNASIDGTSQRGNGAGAGGAGGAGEEALFDIGEDEGMA